MKKSDFYVKVFFFAILCCIAPFIVAIKLLSLEDRETGTVLGALFMFALSIYFSVKLYRFVDFNKTMLIDDNEGSSHINLFTIKCKELIKKYEKNNSLGFVSCEALFVDIINKNKQSIKPNIENLESSCNFFLMNQAFKLISSGNYHLYYGELNQQEGTSLLAVYKSASKWLLDNQYITQEQHDDSYANLRENIRTVG